MFFLRAPAPALSSRDFKRSFSDRGGCINTGDMNDPFIHVLKQISVRLKDELSASFPRKAKAISTCKSYSDRMQGYYYNWEANMNLTMDGVHKMDTFKELAEYNEEIRTAITEFNETINEGREMMGEIKRNWSNKCKRVYRDLDVKNNGASRVQENLVSTAQILATGLKEISAMAKENYEVTKKACVNVFNEYNVAMKAAPPKAKKKFPCKKIIVTPKVLGSYIGVLPSQRKNAAHPTKGIACR